MTEESKPYAIQAKDFDPETQEWSHPLHAGRFSSSDHLLSYGPAWIVVRDKPKRVHLETRLEQLDGEYLSWKYRAITLIDEGYATEYPK